MDPSLDGIDKVLKALEHARLSVLDFISSILSFDQYKQHYPVLYLWSCGSKFREELNHLLGNGGSSSSDLWAECNISMTVYV